MMLQESQRLGNELMIMFNIVLILSPRLIAQGHNAQLPYFITYIFHTTLTIPIFIRVIFVVLAILVDLLVRS